jgi:hypothetical protein
VALAAFAETGPRAEPTLVGRAVLPADTFSVGPTSGHFIEPANDRHTPFVSQQPVQGISAVLRGKEGTFLALSDNGFGGKVNSPDYTLRVYRIRPDFRTAEGGAGHIIVEGFFSLRDPDRKVNFPIVADRRFYPGTEGQTPVDPMIRRERLLTGADFDVESFRQLPDDTFYFGDEFGPFLLHADRTGRLLEAPIPLPGVQSPDNPFLEGAEPDLGGRRASRRATIKGNRRSNPEKER